VEADDGQAIANILRSGADPNETLDGNVAAAVVAWNRKKLNAFQELVRGGAKLSNSPAFDNLIRDLVEDVHTDPELVRLALRAGAPVKPGYSGDKPACVARRQEFRTALREAGYTC
jgi:hypothetical protein